MHLVILDYKIKWPLKHRSIITNFPTIVCLTNRLSDTSTNKGLKHVVLSSLSKVYVNMTNRSSKFSFFGALKTWIASVFIYSQPNTNYLALVLNHCVDIFIFVVFVLIHNNSLSRYNWSLIHSLFQPLSLANAFQN